MQSSDVAAKDMGAWEINWDSNDDENRDSFLYL